MTNYLIIKAYYDDFERIIGEEMSEYDNIETLPVESFDDAKSKPWIRLKQITNKICELKRNKYFDKFDKIIVFENPYVPIILKMMINKKIYLYNWGVPDPLRSKVLSVINKIIVPVYVFDKEMANKYKMPFNDQFYFPNLAKKYNDEKTEYSVYFIGNDKGRFEIVKNIRDILKENKITYNLQVVRQYQKPEPDEDPIISHQYKNYEEILKEISKTDIVLDIVKNNQHGATLRIVEALFFDKKIITNNKDVKTWDIYKSGNVFVIDDLNKDKEKLIAFIKQEFKEYKNDYKQYYSFENWIKRFQ